MEVDHVFSEIGEFGPVQIKLFFLLGLPMTWMALHTLAPNFICTGPGWTCSIPDPSQPPGIVWCDPMAARVFQGSSYSAGTLPVQNSTVKTDVVHSVLVTDPEAKCSLYEQGECVPEFSKDYTSIVTTVWSGTMKQ